MGSANPKKVSTLGTIAIMSMFFIAMGFTVVTPAMAKFAEAFPNNNFVLISTLPTLFIVIGTFLSGSVAGKKLSYKTLAVTGSLLFLIGGVAPAYISGFNAILVCRAVFGLGIGFMIPLGNALVIGNFEGQKRASLLGYGTLFMNFGGILFQMLGGILADINWQMTFWAHTLVIFALIFSFLLPEPPKADTAQTASAPKEKLGKPVWVIALLLLIYNMINYPIMMNLSILFIERNAGGATAAATALSLFTVAGCVAGLLFGNIFKALRRFCIPLGFTLCALGAVLVRFGTSGLLMTMGLILIGFGFSVILPSFMTWMGISTPPSTVAMAASIVMALMNLGGFVCAYWLEIINAIAGETIITPINIAIGFFILMVAVFLIYNPYKSMAPPPLNEVKKN
ncbi:MAG: MFS transporter [Oscillospiraceae bacterium]